MEKMEIPELITADMCAIFCEAYLKETGNLYNEEEFYLVYRDLEKMILQHGLFKNVIKGAIVAIVEDGEVKYKLSNKVRDQFDKGMVESLIRSSKKV